MDGISFIDPKKASDIFCHNPREFSMISEPFNSSLCSKSANCFGIFTLCRWCQHKLCLRMLTKTCMLSSLHMLQLHFIY
ncbi:hypothetical protein NC651_038253 [Populus alba x Populus x berolinensis]|nr:hypothetical protein NC651_038253 [Populus alba x Populus x berolinensis]